jgi:Zn-finger nucleic acid-binding protein/DNA-directed RNA polymerase subunit RPC12/RpoP
MPDLTCPGCSAAMHSLALPRTPLTPLAVDVCDTCQALWLDATESQQMTPSAVIAMFRVIGASHPTSRAAYPALLPCPRCTTPLALTQDIQHTTRFTYYRCRYDHGRFTPYVQFLREKNFIRPLDPAEIERLRAVVTTVRCVSCGAPVPLERSAVCPYCGAPVMLLDPKAVQEALARLSADEAKRTTAPPPSGDAIIAIANVERELAKQGREEAGESAVDLVMLGFRALDAFFAH